MFCKKTPQTRDKRSAFFGFLSIFNTLGFDERRGRGDRGNPNLDPEMDIQQNREFYMHNDVRPPYTYAALIRYVSILENLVLLLGISSIFCHL